MPLNLPSRRADFDKDIDADFKQASVWVEEWKLVVCDRDASDFVWDDGAITSSGLAWDKMQAEASTK